MNGGNLIADQKVFNKVVNINARPSKVWHVLTVPDSMKKWVMPDFEIDIITDWTVGSPLIIRGKMNGMDFENNGFVLQVEFEKALCYSHLSSISRLPDRPESYTIVELRLQPIAEQTALALTLRNFPSESIYRHLAFYWNVALETLKRLVEEQD